MMRLLKRLLQYIKMETEDKIIYMPSENYWKPRSIDIDKLAEELRKLEFVEKIEKKGNWLIVKLSRKVGKIYGILLDLARKFNAPIAVLSRYEVGFPVTVEPDTVHMNVIENFASIEKPFCVTVTGRTFPVKDVLKKLGFKFDSLSKTWTKCVKTPDEVYETIDTVIENIADQIAVTVPKDIDRTLELYMKEYMERLKIIENRLKTLKEVLEKTRNIVVGKFAGAAREFVETGRWRLIIPKPNTVCFKPKEFLGDKFKEIRKAFREAGGDYRSGLGFCITVDEQLWKPTEIDPEKLEEELKLVEKTLKEFKLV